MSTSSRSIGVALVVVAGVGLLARWALTEDERPASPAAAPVVAAARPVATVAPPVRALPPPSEPDLEAALDGFLGAIVVTPPNHVDSHGDPHAVLSSAAKEDEDPVTTRLALEDLTRRAPPARVALADALADLPARDARFGFPAALALAAHLDGPATARLLERLADAPARNRPNLVFALRGSPEPRADAAFAALYTDPDPAVRDAAAFVLGERGERLSPDVRDPALARARAALAAGDPAGWAAAADVLGAPPLAAGDRALLLDLLAHDREPGRRLLALRALAGANVPVADLRPALEAAVNDPLADEALRAAVRAVLERS
jgi:hypothetical protein